MDIADIKVRMKIEIKLESYHYNKYGTVKNTVKYVGSSSFNNKHLGNMEIKSTNVLL